MTFMHAMPLFQDFHQAVYNNLKLGSKKQKSDEYTDLLNDYPLRWISGCITTEFMSKAFMSRLFAILYTRMDGWMDYILGMHILQTHVSNKCDIDRFKMLQHSKRALQGPIIVRVFKIRFH